MPSWFTELLTKAKSTPAVDYTFEAIPQERGGTGSRPLVADEEYIVVKVRAANIVEVTKWVGHFHACVHARTKFIHEEDGQTEVQTVLSSEMMKGLDAAHLDRVIPVDREIVGPIPYRGKMSLELGLFSVKGGDMAGPYIDLLTGMTGVAGAYVQQALTFAEPLRKGFDLLFGNTDQAQLEIGLEKSWTDVSTGTWLLMRAPAGAADTRDLTIAPETGHLQKNSQPFRKYPYVVLQIEATNRRDKWQTPELLAAWKAVGDAAKAGDLDKANKEADRLLTIALWSPDLVTDDARRLHNKVRQKLGLPPAPNSGRLSRTDRIADTGRMGDGTVVDRRKLLAELGDLANLDLNNTAR